MARYRKLFVALAGALGQALNAGLLHGQVQQWGTVLLAGLTAAGVYAVSNAPSKETT